jgi:hypothetical protein
MRLRHFILTARYFDMIEADNLIMLNQTIMGSEDFFRSLEEQSYIFNSPEKKRQAELMAQLMKELQEEEKND